MCLSWSNEIIYFNCEVGCGHMLCHMFQNSSCYGSSVIFHGLFNPGHIVKDASIDANISSQNTAICIRQDSIKYSIADCRGTCDFLQKKESQVIFQARDKESNPERKASRIRYLAGQPPPRHNAHTDHVFCDVIGFIGITALSLGDYSDVHGLQ